MNTAQNIFRSAIVVICLAPLGGCGLGYYWQATTGHLDLMSARRPVSEVIADPATPEAVRVKLEETTKVLEFAHGALELPDNGSYTLYADTGRDYVVWNVFAAAEFSLTPRTWCFPVVGCVSYRGYFDEDRARKFAAGLSEKGDDVFVGGVTAYSTLGRFSDPLLNTMMPLSDYRLAGLIFHELAHQQMYVDDDSMFNESFASFVEREGIIRWLQANSRDNDLCNYSLWLERRTQLRRLLKGARQRLEQIYAGANDDAVKRSEKAAVLVALGGEYQTIRDNWRNPPYFDAWFGSGLNNAQLVALSVYDHYVPAFEVLMENDHGNMGAFYTSVAALADLPVEARYQALQELMKSAVSDRRSFDRCRAPIEH
jgi:predicted aminopeptidase